MKTFIDKSTEYIYEKYNANFSNLCIVFPNIRSGLFFKKSLSKLINKPIFLPAIYSSEKFIEELSGYSIVDNFTLVLELYEIHKNLDKKNQSFEDFIKWGNILINDFNDIDLYLENARNIFTFLSESKAISLWNLDQKPLSDFQLNYLKFYNSLYNYYEQLNIYCESKLISYQGFAYRKVAENIDNYINNIIYDKIIFVGFNALNKAEEIIIKKLIESDKAETLWDVDNYYLKNEYQEAGKFSRKNKITFELKELNFTDNFLLETEKKINIIGVPQKIAQAKLAGNILKNFNDTNTIENTAIVLCDESMLFPVLNSLPENIEKINVTMGYSLKTTTLKDFIDSLFNMHINAAKLSRLGKNDDFLFYIRDFLKIIQNPNFDKLFDYKTNTDVLPFKKEIKKLNRTFFDFNFLQTYFKNNYENIEPIFYNWNKNPLDSINYIKNICEKLKYNYTKLLENDADNAFLYNLEIEILNNFIQISDKVNIIINKYKYNFGLKDVYLIFTYFSKLTKLSFIGEPLAGLQVMGMLETRNLDFENLIMLSVNEDILPASQSLNSLIPFDIRSYNFKLPTYKDADAIYAYHFYRLLQRAKNIYLIYNTESDEFGSGEKSRYIEQIVYELQKDNPKIIITEEILNLKGDKSITENDIKITKTDEIINIIDENSKKGISPTMLNIYRNCSLNYYFKYIAKIEKPEEIEENIEFNTFGKIIHKVLENLFKPYLKTILKSDNIELMLSKVDSEIDSAMKELYNIDEINYGKNLLILNIVKRYIIDFLINEQNFISRSAKENNFLSVIDVEKKLTYTLNIEQINKTVTLNGNIDRINLYNGIYTIVDYKTGKVNDYEITINEEKEFISDNINDKVFQLLMYSYLFSKNYDVEKIKSSIISMQNIKISPLTLTKKSNKEKEDIFNPTDFQRFENLLIDMISEIYNKEIPFSQTNNENICKICDYSAICNRD